MGTLPWGRTLNTSPFEKGLSTQGMGFSFGTKCFVPVEVLGS